MTDLNKIVELQEIASSDFHAKAGKELADGSPVATQEAVIEALRTVQDPELMLDIYSLGMIYKIDISERGNVDIEMTLTSPLCPIAGEMPMMVAEAVANVSGTGLVDVKLVWDPPWTLDRLSDEIKLILGI